MLVTMVFKGRHFSLTLTKMFTAAHAILKLLSDKSEEQVDNSLYYCHHFATRVLHKTVTGTGAKDELKTENNWYLPRTIPRLSPNKARYQ